MNYKYYFWAKAVKSQFASSVSLCLARMSCVEMVVSQLGESYWGVRSECPRDVPLWHADYVELKSIKAQQTQEEFLIPWLNTIFLVKTLPPTCITFSPKEK